MICVIATAGVLWGASKLHSTGVTGLSLVSSVQLFELQLDSLEHRINNVILR